MRFATIQLAERRVGARVEGDRVILLDVVEQGSTDDVHGDSLLVTAIEGLGESVNPTREDAA